MKGDFTRDTFDPAQALQPRADAAGPRPARCRLERAGPRSMLYQLRRLAADLIGPPAGRSAISASLGAARRGDRVGRSRLRIGAGHYYVDGILCELDATWLPVTFADSKAQGAARRSRRSDWTAFRPNQYVRPDRCRSRARRSPRCRRESSTSTIPRAFSPSTDDQRLHRRQSKAAAPAARHHRSSLSPNEALGTCAKGTCRSISTSGSGSSPLSRTTRSARSR